MDSLDGAILGVLQPLVEPGHLNSFARTSEQGFVSGLQSVIPPVTSLAWTVLITGKQQSKHGIFDVGRFDGEVYTDKTNNSDHIRTQTSTHPLSDKEKLLVRVGRSSERYSKAQDDILLADCPVYPRSAGSRRCLPPVRFEEVDNRKISENSVGYTTQEAELIEQLLKGLGYVE
jgi:predicted AlkP superfamily phosphohydrolase/phosphomutase